MFSVSKHGPDDEDAKQFMLPFVDQGIRASIGAIWMSLPKESRTVDELERQFRRLTERAFREIREDATAFGLPPNS